MASKFTFRPVCIKCGQDRQKWAWMGMRVRTMGNSEAEELGPDLIMLTCNNCGYAWEMLPKDTIESAVEAANRGR